MSSLGEGVLLLCRSAVCVFYKPSQQGGQFDGSVIKTLGYFEGSLELENKFEIISIIVTIAKKTTDFLETMCLR